MLQPQITLDDHVAALYSLLSAEDSYAKQRLTTQVVWSTPPSFFDQSQPSTSMLYFMQGGGDDAHDAVSTQSFPSRDNNPSGSSTKGCDLAALHINTGLHSSTPHEHDNVLRNTVHYGSHGFNTKRVNDDDAPTGSKNAQVCRHVSSWRLLRVKKGLYSMLCTRCFAKWKTYVPFPRNSSTFSAIV
jgi:hypothetical protein